MAHGVRCERSGSKRCRCECGGSRHGDQATPIDLGDKQLQLEDDSDRLASLQEGGTYRPRTFHSDRLGAVTIPEA